MSSTHPHTYRQADQLQTLIAAVRATSLDKTKEPLTLTYRTLRGAGPDDHKL